MNIVGEVRFPIALLIGQEPVLPPQYFSCLLLSSFSTNDLDRVVINEYFISELSRILFNVVG